MKTMRILIAATAVVLFASPVLAQQQTGKSKEQVTPRLFSGQGVIRGNDVYDCTGKWLGKDPDANIRAQIQREGDPSCKSD